MLEPDRNVEERPHHPLLEQLRHLLDLLLRGHAQALFAPKVVLDAHAEMNSESDADDSKRGRRPHKDSIEGTERLGK